jgi:hypothetical protein
MVIIWLQRNLESSFKPFSLLAFIINSDGKGSFKFEVKGITISVGAFKLKILF